MTDLRLPSGILFTLFGIILCAAGVFSPGNSARLTDVNINLYSGLVILVFGGTLLWLASRSK